MKVGIIRCMRREGACYGTGDFKAIADKTGAFEGVEENIDLIGYANCGGCPGTQIPVIAKNLVEKGADTIAFSTCMSHDIPIKPACPGFEHNKNAVIQAVGPDVKILDFTHNLKK